MIAGLAASLPRTMSAGLTAQGVPAAVAHKIAGLPPVGSLFAAFLGYNPIKTLMPPQVLHALPAARSQYLTGKTFFPQLISGPFIHGLRIVFIASLVMSLIAAAASWLRGGKYVHLDDGTATGPDDMRPVPVGPFGAPETLDPESDEGAAPEEWVPA
jgi:hypothetical protein